MAREMRTPTDEWENLYLAAGSPDNMLLVGFRADSLKPLTGKTLAEVAEMRGTSPEETAMDLVVEGRQPRRDTIYFLMSEDNMREPDRAALGELRLRRGSLAPEGVVPQVEPAPPRLRQLRPRAGQVRPRRAGTLPRRARSASSPSLPAANLKLDRRGRLAPGYFADVVVFDPDTIQDHATYAEPHQYATGMVHVFVNGVQVLKDGEHTGATPGRVVRGPGWTGAGAQS